MKLPRFSLREVFLLVALVAMGLGWWLDHRRQAIENLEFGQRATLWRQRAHWLAFAVGSSYEISWTSTEMAVRQKGKKAYYGMTTHRYDPRLDIDEQPLGIAIQNGSMLSTWDGEPATVMPDDYPAAKSP